MTENSSYLQTCFLCHNFSLPRFARFVPYLSFLHAKEDQRGEACLEPEKMQAFVFFLFRVLYDQKLFTNGQFSQL